MPLQIITFAQLQQIFATNYSSVAEIPANTDAGSSLGAIANANALLGLNIQNELVYVVGISRLATSAGPDADSFVDVFVPDGAFRLGASYASGVCTVSTPSNVSQPFPVPVGGIVQTNNGTQFAIIADPSNLTGFWSSATGQYLIPVGSSSANVLVQCTIAGTIGNVQPGQITTPGGTSTSPLLTGISSCNNSAAYTNGIVNETDPAMKTRFALLMSTGTVGTDNALAAAILGVQAGLTYTIGDAMDASGNVDAGYVTVFVNFAGSSTAAPGTLLSAVAAVLTGPNVRSAGDIVSVLSPSILLVNVTANIKIAQGYTGQAAAVIANAKAALQAYLSGIGLSPNGTPQLAQISESYVALRTTPGVANVTSLLLNGLATDVPAGYGVMLAAGSITLDPY